MCNDWLANRRGWVDCIINKCQARSLKSVCGFRREQIQLNRQGKMRILPLFVFESNKSITQWWKCLTAPANTSTNRMNRGSDALSLLLRWSRHLLKRTQKCGSDRCATVCMCFFPCMFWYAHTFGVVKNMPRNAPCMSMHTSPAVTHSHTLVMPLKIVIVSLGDIPGETHTPHSSGCILGFHSLKLRHLQTHIWACLHVHRHKQK